MKTDLNICMQWVDTIVEPSEACLMSQNFYESRESTMPTSKETGSCSSWSSDHISDIKSQWSRWPVKFPSNQMLW